ncbi:MAG: hypothetical protein ABS53_08925 [Hydrogenophaga sp. SCN 70-13]|uniref:hybrid sensor histidine kinase/response regulator n=1 Tax=Hydrogenophaga sp. 70-12 TaxID=1895769 RepID=UPI000869D18C|nr:ATP-binding protein [Hydrogenophaga sp. 70-12]ODT32061.1 MAG: hypothetical protein ABS53_08925 [Hydrogenophaga sp. SCN 70-13]OJV52728.1 MAG: hypothetical protein BGO22_13480 [Hydrogenophaga sp. 70-12]
MATGIPELMWFHLPTLLAVWTGIDVVIGLAFWAQHRRLRHVGGLGWWALACLTHTCAAAAMMARPLLPGWVGMPLSNLLFSLTFALLWVGFRAYLGLSVRRVMTGVLLLLLVQWPVNVFFIEVIDSLPARQLLWLGTNVALLLLMIGDARAHRPWPAPTEFRALESVLWLQVALLLGYALIAVVLRWPFLPAVALLTFCFLIAYLLCVLAFQCLLMLRLRDEAQAARAVQRQREADLQRLVDNLDAGVMVFHPDHTLWRMNTAARRFLTWSAVGADGVVPEPSYESWLMLDENGQPLRRHDRPFERVLITGQPVRDVVVGLPIDGGARLRWALCSGYPENDSQGGLRRVVLTFIDITAMKDAQSEQKALEARLSQSQKMQALGTLAGGVAHDFNNILTAILGNADLAREDLPAQAPAHESLGEISTAARRGRELVRQILTFSRQQPLARARVPLAAVVVESCALLRAALPSQVQLVQTIVPPLPEVSGDATQLQQVLVNLGTNALHALPAAGGRIEVALDSVPVSQAQLPPALAQACRAAGLPVLRLRVIDDGCGMDERVQRRMFEPFFTTKPVGQGTGLGLSVVLGLVEAHGGHIEVCSTPQKGTTITLWLPPLPADEATAEDKPVTMPAVENPQPRPDAPASPEGAPHILYLDDDDTLVFLVRRLLERRGYRVTALSVQADALAALRDKPGEFALLLTDYNMPGMSGLEVAREALSIEPRLTVAVASGYITDELQAEARAAGVREVVFKTDAVEQFCEIVARLVKSSD